MVMIKTFVYLNFALPLRLKKVVPSLIIYRPQQKKWIWLSGRTGLET